MHQLVLKKYFLPFAVLLTLLSFSSCEKKYNTVVDSINSAPLLTGASLSQDTINTDTVDIGLQRSPEYMFTIQLPASVRVSHAVGVSEIGTVRYSITSERFSFLLNEGFLTDDGIQPDISKGDSIYSGYVSFQIPRSFLGQLTALFWSKSTGNFSSNIEMLPIHITRTNSPPFIPALPEIISQTQTNSIEIKIKALDSDGQADIKTVYRVTKSGKMYKLAREHDTIGDSIFTEYISPCPPPGAYPFRFFAIDYSYDSSNVVLDTIVIK